MPALPTLASIVVPALEPDLFCNPRLYHLYHSRMVMSNIYMVIGNYSPSITTPLLSPLLLFLKMRYFYSIELEVDQTLFLKIFV